MTRQDLFAELSATPNGELTVWAVLFEDVYETVYGDGYYAYLADAFFTREEAEQFAATSSAYRFHIRQVKLTHVNGQIHAETKDPQPFETIDPAALIASLTHDPTRRKPKSQY